MESKISNFEWGMVIGLFACIDLTQFLLDLTGIGEFVNPIVDPAIGIFLWFYFWMRGVDMKDGKRVLSMVCTFIGESIPVIDALPLWTMDVLIIFFSIKAEKTLKKLAGAELPTDDKQKKVQKQQESDIHPLFPKKMSPMQQKKKVAFKNNAPLIILPPIPRYRLKIQMIQTKFPLKNKELKMKQKMILL